MRAEENTNAPKWTEIKYKKIWNTVQEQEISEL